MGAAAAIGAAIGSGLGLVKHNQEKAEFNRQKELAARTAEWSPWTGLQPQIPQKNPNSFNSIIGGAFQGGQLGAGGFTGSGWGGGGSDAAIMPGASQMIPSSEEQFQQPTLYGNYGRGY